MVPAGNLSDQDFEGETVRYGILHLSRGLVGLLIIRVWVLIGEAELSEEITAPAEELSVSAFHI